MKQITIDYTVSPASVSDEILGNQGESLATELAVKLPAEMINDGSIAEFCGAFGSRIGIFHSKRIAKSEITDGVLLIPITAEISSKPSVSFQVEAFSSDDSLIMKTSLIEGLTFNKSVCRNHSDLSSSVDPAELANITAEIKANTLARHTHANIETLDKLGETNGNLTYKGREVGSGGSGGSGGKEEIYIGSGEMPEGYVLQIDPEGTADSIPTKTSQLINDSGFITLKDLPANRLPSVTEADNGKVLRVVNGVWNTDEIPAVSGGSVIGEFELIEEIVIEESIAGFKRDVEPDGTPYDFKWIYIYLYSPNTNAAHGGRFYLYNNLKNLFSPLVAFTNKNDYMIFGVADIFGGCSQNMFFTDMSRSNLSSLNLNMNVMFDEHITKIHFKIPTNKAVLMKDDIIKIYGVRW